jgi:hypothetical protein
MGPDEGDTRETRDCNLADEVPRPSVYSPDSVLGPGEVMVLDDDGEV